MNPTLLRRFGAVLVFSFVTVTSIVPPAHAEDAAPPKREGLRHGSRATAADGTMVVYDKVSGVYLVPNRKLTYWVGDRFYQYEGGVWLSATAVAGPWQLTPQHKVPVVARDRQRPVKDAATAQLPSGGQAVYDPQLRAYKVAGRKGVFLFDAEFYRCDGGVWLGSSGEDGPWTPTSVKTLPPPLRKAMPAPEAGASVTLPSGDTVVYDAAAKLFHVEGKPDTLLFDGMFFEKREDQWFSSLKASTGFIEMPLAKVPAPVRMKYHRPGSGIGKTKKDKKDPQVRKDGSARKNPNRAARRHANQGRQKKDRAAGKPQGQKNAAKSPPATAGDEDEE